MIDSDSDLNETVFLDCMSLITAEARAQEGPPPAWDSKILDRPDHRLIPRKPVTRRIGLVVRSGVSGLGRDLGAGLVDVTQDGLGIRLKELVNVGQEVTIDLSLPGVGKALRVAAEVRWCQATEDGTIRAGVCLRRRLPYTALTDLTR